LNFLTYLFPLAAIAFVLMLFYSWIPLLRREPADGDGPSASRLSFAAERGRMTGRDRWYALAIALVYAGVAFIGLGDTEAPQSFCYFADRGRYADIELPEETEIGSVMYYCGLHTGNYYLQFSDDGVNFDDVSTMEQNYAALFKWKTAEFTEGATTTARYIRIIADDELSLGAARRFHIHLRRRLRGAFRRAGACSRGLHLHEQHLLRRDLSRPHRL